MVKVLIVDDDAVSRLVLEHQLISLGLHVEAVDGVRAAMAALRRSLIDLVICEYRLPQRSGLDLLDELAGCPIPFVLLAESPVADRPGDRRLGAVSARLTKPLSADDVQALIRRLVPSPLG